MFACQIGVAGFGRNDEALSSKFGVHSGAKKITLLISHRQLESHALKGKKSSRRWVVKHVEVFRS